MSGRTSEMLSERFGGALSGVSSGGYGRTLSETWRDMLTECQRQNVRTPLYVFDLGELERRIAFLRANLPSQVELCYAVKANPFIVKQASVLADGLEICSPGEYRICRNLGITTEKFVISGVNKNVEWLEELVGAKQQPSCYTIESWQQLEQMRALWMQRCLSEFVEDGEHRNGLSEFCACAMDDRAWESKRDVPRKLRILLRLTSGNQFGLDEANLEQMIAKYKDDNYVEICGIQFFSGTQKTSLKKIQRELRHVDLFLMKLKEQYGFEAKVFEFGPGFPVSYFEGEGFADVCAEREFLKGFSELLKELRFQGRVVLELGRSIAASCGQYLTKIVDKKCNLGERYAIVDGGIHQLAYYGQFMAMKKPKMRRIPAAELEAVCGQASGEQAGGQASGEQAGGQASGEQAAAEQVQLQDWNICGSLCTVNDILVKQASFEALELGDILVFEKAGAYCVTEGIALFLSRDVPAVVLRDKDGKIYVARKNLAVDALNMPNGMA